MASLVRGWGNAASVKLDAVSKDPSSKPAHEELSPVWRAWKTGLAKETEAKARREDEMIVLNISECEFVKWVGVLLPER